MGQVIGPASTPAAHPPGEVETGDWRWANVLDELAVLLGRQPKHSPSKVTF